MQATHQNRESRRGPESLLQHQLVDLPLGNYRCEQKEKPNGSTDEAGASGSDHPEKTGGGKDDGRGNFPGAARVGPQPPTARQQNQGRSDGEEKQDVIDVNHCHKASPPVALNSFRIQKFLRSCRYATCDYLLSRCDFFVVLLGNAGLVRAPTALQRPGRVPLEDRVDG